jgi:hypothetical protein
MKQPVKITLISAGVGLLTLGVIATAMVRAQTVSSGVDTALPSDTVTAATTTTPTPSTTTTVNRHQQRLDEMAQTLGITSDQLKSELQSGKQFYQIAAEHGMTYDKLKTQQDEKVKARLDDMVKVGFLTQDEANTMLQQYQTQSQQSPIFGMGMGHKFRGIGFGF